MTAIETARLVIGCIGILFAFLGGYFALSAALMCLHELTDLVIGDSGMPSDWGAVKRATITATLGLSIGVAIIYGTYLVRGFS